MPGTTAAAGCSLLINPKLIRLWDVSAPPEWKHTTLVPARGCEDYNYVDVSWYDWINPYPWDTPLREFFISDLGFWPIWVGGLRILPLFHIIFWGRGSRGYGLIAFVKVYVLISVTAVPHRSGAIGISGNFSKTQLSLKSKILFYYWKSIKN